MYLAAKAAHAGWFGYSSTVRATDGSNVYEQKISSGSLEECETERRIVVNGWKLSRYEITSYFPCLAEPIDLDLGKFEHIDLHEGFEWPTPWPWPVCLSCPYLLEDVIDLIYPQTADKVDQLVQEFGIDQYVYELQELQSNYDLKGFELKMHSLEMQINQDSLNR